MVYPPFLLSALPKASKGVIHQLSVFYVVFSAAQAASSNNRFKRTPGKCRFSIQGQWPPPLTQNVI